MSLEAQNEHFTSSNSIIRYGIGLTGPAFRGREQRTEYTRSELTEIGARNTTNNTPQNPSLRHHTNSPHSSTSSHHTLISSQHTQRDERYTRTYRTPPSSFSLHLPLPLLLPYRTGRGELSSEVARPVDKSSGGWFQSDKTVMPMGGHEKDKSGLGWALVWSWLTLLGYVRWDGGGEEELTLKDFYRTTRTVRR
jgi:hypothetical protein